MKELKEIQTIKNKRLRSTPVKSTLYIYIYIWQLFKVHNFGKSGGGTAEVSLKLAKGF